MKQAAEINERDIPTPKSSFNIVESLWQFEDPISGLPPIPEYMQESISHEIESVSTIHRPSHLSSSFEAEKGLKASAPKVLSPVRKLFAAAGSIAPTPPLSSVATPKNDFGVVKTIISKYSAHELEELLSSCNKKQRLVLLQALLLSDQA
jgi:hypothetical protein